MIFRFLTRFIRWFPNWVEALIVLGVVFGPFIVPTLQYAAAPDFGIGEVEFTDDETMWLVRWEIAVLVIVGIFLWARGWKKEDLPLGVSWASTKSGLVLWLVTTAAYYAIGFLLMLIPVFAASAETIKFSMNVSLLVAVILSIVNPVFEEVFTVGYLFRRMETFHPAIIILTSAGLRGMIHGYQGGFSMTQMVIFGIFFALHFQKHRKLWPLIMVHAIDDFLALTLPQDLFE